MKISKKPESIYIQSICVVCNVNKQCTRGLRNNKRIYRAACSTCHKKRYKTGKYIYTIHKKDSCKSCGFIPINECQLDVDHIDNNHNNNDPDNLQTLCANCHRLKTYLAKKGAGR